MRVSTNMQYRSHLGYLQNSNSLVDQASQRYNTGKKFQTAGEDPTGMATSIKYGSDIKAYQQYKENAGIVSDQLSQEETALGQIWDSLSSVKTRLQQVVNGTLDDGGRAAIAEDVKQVQSQIFDLMNTKNAEGEYIFSGAQSDTPTYKLTSDGKYVCQADGSNKYVIVSPTVKLQTTDSGLNIFENCPQVSDPSLVTGTNTTGPGSLSISNYDQFNTFYKNNYSYADGANNNVSIKITSKDGESPITWSLVGTDGTTELEKGEVKDGKITVQGMTINLPEDYSGKQSDKWEISLGKPEKGNILNELSDIINKLSIPQDEWDKQTPPMTTQSLTAAVTKLQENVTLAMKQTDTYRGYVGARGANIDAIIKSDETLGDVKSDAKANATEVDAFEAVSDLVKTQNALQVAQQTFHVVHSSSLFDFI